MYLPFATPIDTVFLFVSAAIPVLNGVSDAIVRGADVYYRHIIDNPPPTVGLALVHQKLLLFYRNGDYSECVFIPAPKAEIFEQTGQYAGMRLDLGNPLVQTFSQDIAAMGIELTTVEGDPLGVDLVAGGLAL